MNELRLLGKPRMSLKSRNFLLPLCSIHHRELHSYGDEKVWWEKLGNDPFV